jgi:hypothetical protein
MKNYTLMKNHERLRNILRNPLRVCRKNEQQLAKLLLNSGKNPQGRARNPRNSHKVALLSILNFP